MFGGFALAFQLATVIVLVADRCNLGTILGVVALVFGAATFFTLLASGSRASRYYSASVSADPKTREGGGTAGPTIGRPSPPPDTGPHGPTGR